MRGGRLDFFLFPVILHFHILFHVNLYSGGKKGKNKKTKRTSLAKASIIKPSGIQLVGFILLYHI